MNRHDVTELRNVGLASLGGVLEYFDFQVYVFVAAALGSQLFPPGDSVWKTQVQAFGIFAIGYLVRPVAGMVIAHYADRIGRKRLFVFTVLLMSVPTFLMGLLPTYAMAGWMAPACLLLLRVLQGCAVGGELPGAAGVHLRARHAAAPGRGQRPLPGHGQLRPAAGCRGRGPGARRGHGAAGPGLGVAGVAPAVHRGRAVGAARRLPAPPPGGVADVRADPRGAAAFLARAAGERAARLPAAMRLRRRADLRVRHHAGHLLPVAAHLPDRRAPRRGRRRCSWPTSCGVAAFVLAMPAWGALRERARLDPPAGGGGRAQCGLRAVVLRRAALAGGECRIAGGGAGCWSGCCAAWRIP